MKSGKRQIGGLLTSFIALLVSLTTPAAATAKPGALDRGFSGDGKAVTVFPENQSTDEYVNYRLPFEFAPGRIAMAPAGGGKIVTANSKAIVMHSSNGRRNARFGGNGAVPIGGVEGSRFQLADIAVDSQGRVLIAGTTKPVTRFGMIGPPMPGPIPSMATIRRYQSNGQADPTFGNEGVVNTGLGAGPPTFEGQPYPGSAVAVVGLTVDQADRPIVTGSAVFEVRRCAVSQSRYEASQAIVARLTANGAADASFAGNGLKTIGGLSWLGSPGTTGVGIVSAGARVDPCRTGDGPDNPSVLVGLSNDGGLNPGLRGSGFWSRPFLRIADLALMPSGKLVLLARTIELVRGRWRESAGSAIRLRRNGSFDSSFGRGGQADLALPKRGSIAAIAADRKGRVLLAGTVSPKRIGKKGPRSKFLLMRMTAAGERDGDFGWRGRVATGFGARTNVRGTEVLVVPGGRIAVGGKLSGPSTDNGFGLARYLGQ